MDILLYTSVETTVYQYTHQVYQYTVQYTTLETQKLKNFLYLLYHKLCQTSSDVFSVKF